MSRLMDLILGPSLMDLLGILVVLVVVVGATAFPQLGEFVGRRIAKAKGLPLPEKRSKKGQRVKPAGS